jgi:hypothetical protein
MSAVKSVAAASKRSCELTGKSTVISTAHNVKQQTFMNKKGKIQKKKIQQMAPVSEVSASQLPTFPAAVLKPISL